MNVDVVITGNAAAWIIADPLFVQQLAAAGVSMLTVKLAEPLINVSAHHSGEKGECALLLSNDGERLTVDVQHAEAITHALGHTKLPAGWVEKLLAAFVPSGMPVDYSGGLFSIALPGLRSAGVQGGAINIIVEAE